MTDWGTSRTREIVSFKNRQPSNQAAVAPCFGDVQVSSRLRCTTAVNTFSSKVLAHSLHLSAACPLQAGSCHRQMAEVIHVADAPPPHLQLALNRARLLKSILAHGSTVLQYVIQWCWQVAPQRSWLGLFVEDIRAVAQFQPDVASLRDASSPVHALIEAGREQPAWWLKQVQSAGKKFLQEVQQWIHQPRPHVEIQLAPRPFLFMYAVRTFNDAVHC